MLVDWLSLRTGLTAAGLIELCKWGIGQVSQSKRKRQAKSDKWKNHIRPLLVEVAKFCVTAVIVVLALAYERRSMPRPLPRYVGLAKGLLQELNIQPSDNGGSKINFTITPLGEQFLKELCRIKQF